MKTAEKGLRQPFDSPFELGLGFCFQQNVYGGGYLAEGTQAEGHKKIAKIAKHRRN